MNKLWMISLLKKILKTSNSNIGVKDINKNGIKVKYDKEKYTKQIEDIKLWDLNGKKNKSLNWWYIRWFY